MKTIKQLKQLHVLRYVSQNGLDPVSTNMPEIICSEVLHRCVAQLYYLEREPKSFLDSFRLAPLKVIPIQCRVCEPVWPSGKALGW